MRSLMTVPMIDTSHTIPVVGVVICPQQRPATPTDVWIELLAPGKLALRDPLLIDGTGQHLLGIVIEMERVMHGTSAAPRPSLRRPREETTLAKLAIISSSDGLQRPPEGTAVRLPSPEEVTTLLGEARRIPVDRRVPLGVLSRKLEIV